MKLKIFDFDGTLMNTPTKPFGWKGGWWGKGISLVPPPIPESALVLFLEETHRSLREWALPKEYSAAWETILASCDAGETGTLLESSCRKMDHLFLFVWKELNRFRKAHNIPWKQLAQNDLPADLQLQKDLVQLIRPVRDLLYFRRHFSGWLEPSATPSSTP
jgi:hypothetical protein